MLDHSAAFARALTNAQIVTPDGIVEGGLSIVDGRIEGVSQITDGQDMHGCYLVSGVVDVHTDHVERHTHPRIGVLWPALPALLAYDAVVISGGTTTVFDSLSVGASMQRQERRDLFAPLVETLREAIAEDLFRAEHLLHLRCEVSDPATPALVNESVDFPETRLISVMDHTPGDRQSPDVNKWFSHMVRDMEVSDDEGRRMMHELLERSRTHGPRVRNAVTEAGRAANVPLMSHDDRTIAHVEEAVAEGCTISEFPTTLEAARHARKTGMAIVAGAPNFLRGGSQSGNVAVAELLSEGLVDVLASDYIPRSPLDAAFAIAKDPAQPYDLPQAMAMVSAGPAALTGLSDRGAIKEGMRADLVAVKLVGGQPVVQAVWRAGRRVF